MKKSPHEKVLNMVKSKTKDSKGVKAVLPYKFMKQEPRNPIK